MAKRRSSLKGRGAEILFGTPAAVEIEPLGRDTTLAEEATPATVPGGEAAPDDKAPGEDTSRDASTDTPDESLPPPPFVFDEEMELALYEEAREGEPGPGREEDLSVLEEELPPTPEMESAFLEEALGAEEPIDPMLEVVTAVLEETLETEELPDLELELETPPLEEAGGAESVEMAPETPTSEETLGAEELPEPALERPIPTMEELMEELALSEEIELAEPPPPEISDLTSSVLPPRPTRRVLEIDELERLSDADVQAGGEAVKPYELPDLELTEEEKELLLARLGDDRIQALDQEISKTYDQVLSRVGENEDLATECYNYLLKARDIVLRRDAARIAQAEYYVEQVRALMKRATESEAGAKKYAWWIAGWGVFWFGAYLSILILLNYKWFQDAVAPPAAAGSAVNMAIFLPAMTWGGIGGVASVFYSLFKHVGRRDFDSQYNLSYVGKPFLGVILGATVYMIVHLLIMILGIMPAGLAEGGDELLAPTIAPWIIYIMAWACGFKENRIFDLVDRVMKRIFSGNGAQPEKLEPTS
jgi:hypothetical protein